MKTVLARDGVELHVAVHDFTDPWREAPILLLQHGFGRSGKFWFNLIPYLARFYRVVCPDLRGVGQSALVGAVDLAGRTGAPRAGGVVGAGACPAR